jgi:hypothetical protein
MKFPYYPLSLKERARVRARLDHSAGADKAGCVMLVCSRGGSFTTKTNMAAIKSPEMIDIIKVD